MPELEAHADAASSDGIESILIQCVNEPIGLHAISGCFDKQILELALSLSSLGNPIRVNLAHKLTQSLECSGKTSEQAYSIWECIDRVYMKNPIATCSVSREYYIIQINGRITSTHRRYEDAVRLGLQLKYQLPHDDIKVRVTTSTEDIVQETVLH